MRILLVVDDPPFPPRSGITIPVCGMARLLKEHGHEVHGLLLGSAGAKLDTTAVEATRRALDSCVLVTRNRKNVARLFIDEAMGRRAAFAAYTYGDSLQQAVALASRCDVIIASPISALDAASRVRCPSQRLIAGISDSYTAVLRTEPRPNWGPLSIARWLFRQLRGAWMGRLEAKILELCDAILVQTELDRSWINRIGGRALAVRVHLLPNGVPEEYFEYGPHDKIPGPVVISVADYTSEHYRRNLLWFHQNVWSLVRYRVPDAVLRVVGRGLEDLSGPFKQLTTDQSVEVRGFVPELKTVYQDARVAIAVVNKSYGFINKVAEALAAGIPVVGDSSAFNGMDGLQETGSILAANEPGLFAEYICRWLTDDEKWLQASRVARREARNRFSWSSRWPTLMHAIRGDDTT